MAKGKKAAQVVIYDLPELMTTEQYEAALEEGRERLIAMEAQETASNRRIGELCLEVQTLVQRVASAEVETQRAIGAYDSSAHEHLQAKARMATLEEREQALLAQIADLSAQCVAYGAMGGQHALPLTQWCVRQALEDKGLEAVLNTLAQEGWRVQTIFDPRGGAYRVVAWREAL